LSLSGDWLVVAAIIWFIVSSAGYVWLRKKKGVSRFRAGMTMDLIDLGFLVVAGVVAYLVFGTH
jgi:hypothetical protein